MTEWILICSNGYFDIKKAFSIKNTITWPLEEGVSVGDVVYFYVTNPYNAILFKCLVESVDIHRMDDEIKDCVTHVMFYENKQIYMRLKVLKQYSDDCLTREKIKNFGITNLQGASKAPKAFVDLVNKVEKRKPAIKKTAIIITAIAIGLFIVLAMILGNKNESGQLRKSDGSLEQEVSEDEIIAENVEQSDVDEVTENVQSNTETKDIKNVEILCYTDKILVGDSIDINMKADNWIIEGISQGLIWKTDNEKVASIDNKGVLTANSVGQCTVFVEYEGKSATKSFFVYEEDKKSGAFVDVDYEKISLSSYGSDTVNLFFGGNMPEHFGATAYYSSGVSLKLEWGEMKENSVPLTITDLYSKEGQGTVTIIVYENDDPEHIVATTKINVRIN